MWLFPMGRAESGVKKATKPGGAALDQRVTIKEQLLLQLLQQKSIWQKDLAEKLNVGQDRISGPLKKLRTEGYIDNVPASLGKPKGKYWALKWENNVLIRLFKDIKYPAVVNGMRSSDLVVEKVLDVFPNLPLDIRPIIIRMIHLSPDFFTVILLNPRYDQLTKVCNPYLIPSFFWWPIRCKDTAAFYILSTICGITYQSTQNF